METQVLIIGGGVTGTGLARDLALRGVACLLVERRDINAGASGANHGLLHSGARYIASDPAAARECRQEGDLLRRLAPHCVADTGGFFVAVPGDDERYAADFPGRCAACGIRAEAVDPRIAREQEPALAPDATAVYAVADGAIDPFMLALDNLADARRHGTEWIPDAEVTGFDIENGTIQRVHLRRARNGRPLTVRAEQVINATGAWAGRVAALAGARLEMVYSQGSLIISQNRLCERVINRLRQATDADILVPAGTVSIFGTTSVRIDDPDQCRPTVAEIDAMLDDGVAMIPALASTRFIRAYAGVRPLVKNSAGAAGDDRSVPRGFSLCDHLSDGLNNFITITGGKLTTYRLMAERTADLVCRRLGVDTACGTRREPLPPAADGHWTEPGRSPREWFKKKDPDDLLLCECEVVPVSVFEQIRTVVAQASRQPSLLEIGQRSRVGKGPCQGAFCSLRMVAHLYNQGQLDGDRGEEEIRRFLSERWRGLQPLLWGAAVSQAELQEALHCGMFGLELGHGSGGQS